MNLTRIHPSGVERVIVRDAGPGRYLAHCYAAGTRYSHSDEIDSLVDYPSFAAAEAELARWYPRATILDGRTIGAPSPAAPHCPTTTTSTRP